MNALDQIVAGVVYAAANPEGTSVRVLTGSEPTARLVAPMLARRLHPDRSFGDVLHVEWMADHFEVVVRDLGAA